MNVIDLISGHAARGTAFSFEVLPPLKGTGTQQLFATIAALREFDPLYVNITTHRSEYVYKDLGNGTARRERVRRRPGTIAVAAAIKQEFGLHVVPHTLCSGFTREDIEYMLLDLQFLGIADLLVLRGDKAREDNFFKPTPGGHAHAIDLIDQINRFNEGFFDLEILRRKAEMGASYAVTQLFYDNKKYFKFVEMAREKGITIPIIPGIKPLAKRSQLTAVPKTFHCDLPLELSTEAARCTTDEEVRQLGIEWAVNQCRELMAAGVPSLHFYTVSAVESIREIARQIY